jgi:heme A synthase
LCNGQLVPAITSLGVALHLMHRAGAVVVALMVTWVYRRIMSAHAAQARLVVLATIALVLVGVQFLLGALTVWNALAVEPTTAHVGGGALLLITMLTLTLRSYRRYSGNAAASDRATEREALA